MSDRVFNVLFICVGNSARSIMAEAILSQLGRGKFSAFSAGTKPYSEMNAFALEVLENNGHDISGMRAKNVAEFQAPDAPALDFAFTLCDAAANEECPPWPGQPITAHWGVPDPAAVEGSEERVRKAFLEAFTILSRRITLHTSLRLDSLDRIAIQSNLTDIGKSV